MIKIAGAMNAQPSEAMQRGLYRIPLCHFGAIVFMQKCQQNGPEIAPQFIAWNYTNPRDPREYSEIPREGSRSDGETHHPQWRWKVGIKGKGPWQFHKHLRTCSSREQVAKEVPGTLSRVPGDGCEQIPLPYLCLSALYIIHPCHLRCHPKRKRTRKELCTDRAQTMSLLRKITNVTKKLQDCVSCIN